MPRASRMREFAGRLLAHEAKGSATGTKSPVMFLVCEKLRPQLAMLMGTAGYRALLSRSLRLAGEKVAWLKAVQVRLDGSLDGPGEGVASIGAEEAAEGSVVLVVQLLELLVAFIGEVLMVRLVREAWPKLSLNDLGPGNGDKHEKTK